MIQYVRQLFRGSASVSPATLYTNTNGETAVITSVAVCNTAAASATYTLTFDGVEYASGITIAANATHTYDDVRQVLTGTDLITGSASATTVRFHIAGTVA